MNEISVYDIRITDAVKEALPSFSHFDSNKLVLDDFRSVHSTLRENEGMHECELLLNIFIKYCIECNRVDEVNFFQPTIEIPRTSAPINNSNYEQLLHIKRFNDQYTKEISKIRDVSDQKLFAAIMYSAIKYGLLLDVKLLKSFSKHLFEQPHATKNRIWFKLKIETDDNGDHSIQIWQPDSFTLLLLNIWYKKKRKSPVGFWFKYLREQLDTDDLLPKSHHDFLKAMKNHLKINYSSFLIDAKSSTSNNRGLELESFLHQLTETSKAAQHQPYPMMCIRETGGRSDEQNLNLRIMKTIKEPDGPIASKLPGINSIIDESNASQSAKSVAYCVAHYLTHKNEFGNINRIGWHERILNQLSSKFVKFFGDVNPSQMSDSQLQAGYQRIIDSCSNDQAPNILKYLRAYHYYLHLNCGRGFRDKLLPRIKNRKQAQIHAQIISEQQYQLMLNWVEREHTSASASKKPIFQSMKVCLILGYRLGLRRSEIMGLRTQDVHLAERSELIVCGYQVNINQRYELKSKSSNRKIRLHHQMPDEELEFLLKYTRERSKASKGIYLVDWHAAGLKKNREDHIFNRITKIMRWVSGRQNARFHQLRHSRATFKMWHCYIVAYDLSPAFSQKITPAELARAKNHLSHNFSTDWKNNRHKILRYLSAEMGHASPATTLANYIHSIDWIADELREKQLPLIGTKTLSQLIGLTRRQIQFIAKKENLITHNQKAGHSPAILRNNLLKQLDKIASQPELRHWHVKGLTDLPEDKSELQDTYLPELQVYHAVKTHLFEGKNIEDIQRSYLDIAEQIQPAIERAQQKNLFPRYIHQVLKQRNTKKSYYLLESIISAYRNMYDKENGKDQTRQQDRAIVRALAKQVTDPEFHMNTASSGYNLYQKRDLQKFIRAIRLLNQYRISGVPIQLELTLYSSNPLNTAARDADWVRWSKAIQVPQNTVFQNKTISSADRSNLGRFQAIERIRIRISNDPNDDQSKQKKRTSSYLYNSGFDTAMRVIVMLSESSLNNRL